MTIVIIMKLYVKMFLFSDDDEILYGNVFVAHRDYWLKHISL